MLPSPSLSHCPAQFSCSVHQFWTMVFQPGLLTEDGADGAGKGVLTEQRYCRVETWRGQGSPAGPCPWLSWSRSPEQTQRARGRAWSGTTVVTAAWSREHFVLGPFPSGVTFALSLLPFTETWPTTIIQESTPGECPLAIPGAHCLALNGPWSCC